MERPLWSAQDLRARLGDPSLVIVDCRFDLMKPEAGRLAYQAGHIPGARYADLNHDLSGPVQPGVTGRHPLPAPAVLSRTLGALGIEQSSTVLAYDDASGTIAARLWWLLRWVGHERVAVLDGGWPAWIQQGGSVTSELPSISAKTFLPQVRSDWVASLSSVEALVQARGLASDSRLLDARALPRFRGEQEPIDRVPGHIPTAGSLPFVSLLDAGRFVSPARIREKFEQALGGTPPAHAVCYCGSGVTACHLLLAAAHAGLPLPRLYAGSYSEWIADGTRAVAVGDE